MKKFAPLSLLPVLALAACGSEPAPAPEPTETVAPEPVSTLAPADETLFKELFAESCPNAEPVNTAFCKRAMGADTASCEFGLGDDDVLRNDAELSVVDDSWVISDPEAVCNA